MSRVSQSREGQGATDTVKESAAQAARSVRDLGENAREAASEKFDELRDQASQYFRQGREQARQWEQSLEEYVQEKPIKSLLIAAGIGMVVGFLWRRR